MQNLILLSHEIRLFSDFANSVSNYRLNSLILVAPIPSCVFVTRTCSSDSPRATKMTDYNLHSVFPNVSHVFEMFFR